MEKIALAKATTVRVLLLSSDIEIIDTLCHFMEQMAIHVEVCSDFNSAARKLCHAKFEGLLVDFKNPADALEFIKKPREMTSHKGAVVLAILNSSNEMPAAFRAGASFALVKPLIPTILTRTLRASYPLMVRERRRYYRCPLQVGVNIRAVPGLTLSLRQSISAKVAWPSPPRFHYRLGKELVYSYGCRT